MQQNPFLQDEIDENPFNDPSISQSLSGLTGGQSYAQLDDRDTTVHVEQVDLSTQSHSVKDSSRKEAELAARYLY